MAPSEVHIHVRRIIVNDIPTSEEMVESWLMETFSKKDQMLSDFHLRGCFPHQGTEGDLPMIPCLVNVLGVIVLTSVCIFLTIFSSVWFRVYLSLVCAYLGSATYFNIRPSPIFTL